MILMGMPAEVTVDLTGLWHRETKIAGSYTYGTETMPDGSTCRTFGPNGSVTRSPFAFDRAAHEPRVHPHDTALSDETTVQRPQSK